LSAAVLGFGEGDEPARALASELGLAFHAIEVTRFPDGESLVRLPTAADTVLLYRSLDNPNAKLVEILLAASAARDCGAAKVILIAPYLAYMRQDKAFRPGEAVSQRAIGRLIAANFDGLVTIDPHLHRISSVAEAIPDIPAVCVAASSVLAAALSQEERPVLVGPDSESRQWVEAIATPLGLDVLLGEKQRNGDREVEVEIPGIALVDGRRAVLVDDIISSGGTLIAGARQLLEAGAARVEALATHCLAQNQDLQRMKDAGIASIRSTRTVEGPTACLPVAGILAGAVRGQGWNHE
jgi:ribose-phosphate pyrophosphokinase